jgi:hypothetical protein
MLSASPAQDRDFVFAETVRKEYVALLVEALDLFRCELHGVSPGTLVSLS